MMIFHLNIDENFANYFFETKVKNQFYSFTMNASRAAKKVEETQQGKIKGQGAVTLIFDPVFDATFYNSQDICN